MLRPAQIALWITAALIGVFAVRLLMRPDDLAVVHGLQLDLSKGLATEIRATQGGTKLGIAVALLILSRPRWVTVGLAVAVTVLAISLLGRLIGLAVDGYTTLHAVVAVAEAIGVLSCGIHWYRLANASFSSANLTGPSN